MDPIGRRQDDTLSKSCEFCSSTEECYFSVSSCATVAKPRGNRVVEDSMVGITCPIHPLSRRGLERLTKRCWFSAPRGGRQDLTFILKFQSMQFRSQMLQRRLELEFHENRPSQTYEELFTLFSRQLA